MTDVLSGSAWKLVQVHGAAPVTPATASFSRDGGFDLDTGCNRVGGTYHLEGNQIIVDQMQQALMQCNGDVAEQEAGILSVMRNRPTFIIVTGSGDLQLTSDAGQVLLFAPG